jgi:hypothetical protein
MFGAEVGGQVAWLLPAALLLLAAGLWLTRRAPRTNRARAAFALWGGWLLVTAAVFSFMQASSTPTMPWPSPRPWGRWSAWAPPASGRCATTR